MTNRPPRSRTPAYAPVTPSAAASPAIRRGLYAYVGHRVVELLTEQQLVDHAVSVLPQLQSVTSRPHFHGPHWTTLRKKNGVELYEFDPAANGATIEPAHHQRLFASSPLPAPPPPPPSSTAASSPFSTLSSSCNSVQTAGRATLPHSFQTKFRLPNPGIDMAYAAVAQCELDGHVGDVLDVLFNDEAIDFEASMKTLWNNKLKRGDLLLSRRVRGRSPTCTASSTRSNDMFSVADLDEFTAAEPGRLAIKTATVGAGLSLKRRQLGAEKLCYTSYTQYTPATREAFHVIKTLPLDIHEQIASGKTHVALRDTSVDHVAVGYHLTEIDSLLSGARTRLVVCAYVSAPPSTTTVSRASLLHWHPRMETTGARLSGSFRGGARGRDAVPADARRIVMLLAKAAREFHQVMRQRRLGSQRFVYFPTDRNSYCTLEQCCVVCLRRFGLFRKDHYCQLCGHLVCRQCSRKHKVEPTAGKVRENRICFPCVARVDTGAFHEEELWKNLGRAVVVDSDAISTRAFDAAAAAGDGEDHCWDNVGRGRGGDANGDNDHSLTMLESAAGDENDYDVRGVARSNRSASAAPTLMTPSANKEIQVAQDLFSPHPQRRASALEALSRVVLESRGLPEYPPVTPTASRTMDPFVVDRYIEETTPTAATTRTSLSGRTSTKSDRMQTFSVCYPRANPTASRSFSNMTPLLESIEQLEACRTRGRTSTTAAAWVDTAAFDSICEAAVQRLGFAMVYFVVTRRPHGTQQVVGMHQASQMPYRLPRDLDLARSCPNGLAPSAAPFVVLDPMYDLRFRDFALVHDARIQFFAEFPIAGISNGKSAAIGGQAVVSASLCVLDTSVREQRVSTEEMKTLKTLCDVAADLISAILH